VQAVADMDEITERILRTYDTITVVGASRHPGKEARGVPAMMRRHGWRIIPVNPHADENFGERAYRTLRKGRSRWDLRTCSGRAGQIPDIARQAVTVGATALWLQSGRGQRTARSFTVMPR
jgi:uncharacterized protein